MTVKAWFRRRLVLLLALLSASACADPDVVGPPKLPDVPPVVHVQTQP